MSTELEGNLQSLLKSKLPMQFVKKHDGKWDHQQWLDFLADIEGKGYAPVDVDQVGLILEEQKEIYLAKK